ncbi:molybdate ABC transporter substrate-binding protein [Microbulbifer magnicolonia]|uniref:molybdate ABC transporter substrate-binding protein n=1 Tax=Microbulbifer magnicolonia TaxID=3109744 RepID=UPI002B41382D|nr:molybdate ABC transporter substrate-binding protein [Microbulbifer sp. GG15]
MVAALRHLRRWLPWLLMCALAGACSDKAPTELRIAVAANFRPALETLRGEFEQDCQCRLIIVSGATGMLYSQIRAGAPFDIFLAADSRRPLLLERDGLIADGSRRTYARGQLALWVRRTLTSAGAEQLPDFMPATLMTAEQLVRLLQGWRGKIVIADPQLAPYGDAAVQLLRRQGLWSRLREQMVYAANVGHAQVLLQEGHARMGLIPLSLALAAGERGEYMLVPVNDYPAIEQQMVVLTRARALLLAQQFQAYLTAPAAQARLRQLGYFPVTPP